MLFQIPISLLPGRESSYSCSPFACGVSTQAAQLWLRCSLDALNISKHECGHFCQAWGSFCIFSRVCTVSSCRPCSGLVRRHAGKGWENWRRLASVDHSSLGWLYKRPHIFWCFLSSNNKMVICTHCFLRNAASFLSHKNGLFPLSEQIRRRDLQ